MKTYENVAVCINLEQTKKLAYCEKYSRSQWLCGLRCRLMAACLLRLWVQIPLRAWMFVCCQCHVLSVRGLCDKSITHPEESHQLWCIVMCDLETL